MIPENERSRETLEQDIAAPINAYLTQLEQELHTGPEKSQDILREIRSHLEMTLLEV